MQKISLKKNKLNSIFLGLGVGILFVLPLFSWTYIRSLGFDSPNDVALSMFLSISFIILSSRKKYINFIFLKNYLIFFLLYLFFLLCFFFTNDIKNILWVVFSITLFFVFSTFDRKIQIYYFISSFYTITLMSCSAYLFINFDTIIANYTNGNIMSRLSVDGNKAYTLVAYAAISLYVTSLIMLVSQYNKFLSLVGLAISLLIMVLSGTRSIYAGLILSTLLIFFKFHSNTLRRNKIKRIFILFLFILLLILALSQINFVYESISFRVEKVFLGIQNFLGNVHKEDPSSLGRLLQREHAITIFTTHPFFGLGIKSYWVDFPLLQILSDLGIFIGAIYIYYVFIKPIYISYKVFSIYYHSIVLKFFSILYLANLPRLFLHGEPYDWTTPIFLIPLLYFYSLYIQKKGVI